MLTRYELGSTAIATLTYAATAKLTRIIPPKIAAHYAAVNSLAGIVLKKIFPEVFENFGTINAIGFAGLTYLAGKEFVKQQDNYDISFKNIVKMEFILLGLECVVTGLLLDEHTFTLLQ